MTQRQYLLKRDEQDTRDFAYQAQPFHRAATVPFRVDLRPYFASIPIFDQGFLGSCTANAICGLKEFNDHIDNTQEDGYYLNLSRLYLYYKERELEGTVNEDSGAMIRDGFKALQKSGVCGESFFPYVIDTFTNAPSSDADENATSHKITQYWRIITLEQLKAALAEGNPVVIGIDVYESFESEEVSQTGVVPLPNQGETYLGGHAVLVVGYDTNTGQIIVRNSWGDQWGDKGYFYLPESYFDNYVMDMWTGK